MTKYDPSKRYTWSPDDKFEFSGQEFGLILNTFRAILNTEQAAHILLAKQCNDAIEVVMQRSVESGMVKETPQPGSESPVDMQPKSDGALKEGPPVRELKKT